MNLEFAQGVLRYLSAAVATFLGILGLLARSRDETTGRLTKGGRLLLIGISCAGIVAVALQIADDLRTRQKEREEGVTTQQNTKRVKDLQTQLLRANYAIRDPVMRYRIVAINVTGLAASYLQRLSKRNNVPPAEAWYGICHGTSKYPDPNRDADVLEATELSIDVDTYVEPIAVSRYMSYLRRWESSQHEDAVAPDLAFELVTGRDGDRSECFSVRPDEEGEVIFVLSGVASLAERSSLSSNGAITSLADLPGAQMFVTIYSDAPDETKFELQKLQFGVGTAGSLTFNLSTLRSYVVPRAAGHVLVYEIRFPQTFEEIMTMMRAPNP